MLDGFRNTKGADCGCPEIEGIIWPYDVILHLEPNGTGEAFFDDGDEQVEVTFQAVTLDELVKAAKDYVASKFGGQNG